MFETLLERNGVESYY